MYAIPKVLRFLMKFFSDSLGFLQTPWNLTGFYLCFSFCDLINSIWRYRFDIESISYYRPHCCNFVNDIPTLLNTLSNANVDIVNDNDASFRVLLYSDSLLCKLTTPYLILNTSREFLWSAKRFVGLLIGYNLTILSIIF